MPNSSLVPPSGIGALGKSWISHCKRTDRWSVVSLFRPQWSRSFVVLCWSAAICQSVTQNDQLKSTRLAGLIWWKLSFSNFKAKLVAKDVVPCNIHTLSGQTSSDGHITQVACIVSLGVEMVPKQGILITCTHHPTFASQSQSRVWVMVIWDQSAPSMQPDYQVIFMHPPHSLPLLCVPLEP